MVVPVALPAEPILLDAGPSPRGWSRLQAFLACPQAYRFRYGPGGARGASTSSHAQIMGSLAHVGLAHYYARMHADQQGTDRERFYDPETAVTMLAAKNGGGEWYETAEKAREIVRTYIDFWAPRERVRPLCVEELFEIRYPCQRGPIRRKVRDERGDWTGEWTEEHEVTLSARIDLVYADSRGKVWTADHKTSFRIEAKHPRAYSMSGQLLNYRWIGAGLWGERYGGVTLNMVQTGDVGRFERPALDPAPALLARFPQIVEDAERRIAELENEDRPIDGWPAAASEGVCVGKYGACPHLEACKWGAAA